MTNSNTTINKNEIPHDSYLIQPKFRLDKNIGSVVKSSKKMVEWGFELWLPNGSVNYVIRLLHSISSQRVRLIINHKLRHSSQQRKGVSRWVYKFVLKGLAVAVIVDHSRPKSKQYSLVIDGVMFEDVGLKPGLPGSPSVQANLLKYHTSRGSKLGSIESEKTSESSSTSTTTSASNISPRAKAESSTEGDKQNKFENVEKAKETMTPCTEEVENKVKDSHKSKRKKSKKKIVKPLSNRSLDLELDSNLIGTVSPKRRHTRAKLLATKADKTKSVSNPGETVNIFDVIEDGHDFNPFDNLHVDVSQLAAPSLPTPTSPQQTPITHNNDNFSSLFDPPRTSFAMSKHQEPLHVNIPSRGRSTSVFHYDSNTGSTSMEMSHPTQSQTQVQHIPLSPFSESSMLDFEEIRETLEDNHSFKLSGKPRYFNRAVSAPIVQSHSMDSNSNPFTDDLQHEHTLSFGHGLTISEIHSDSFNNNHKTGPFFGATSMDASPNTTTTTTTSSSSDGGATSTHPPRSQKEKQSIEVFQF